MKDIQIGPLDAKDKTTGQRMVSSIIWLISTARNIIVVVFCAALGYMYKKHGDLPFKLSSNSTAHFFFIYNLCSDLTRRLIFSVSRSRGIWSPELQATTV